MLSLERAAGSLAQFQSQAKLSYTQKRDIMLGISLGLSALHVAGVIHGDLKSENVLLFRKGSDYVAKLCDFGFSILLADVEGSRARLQWNCSLDGTGVSDTRRTSYRDVQEDRLLLARALFWRLPLDGYNPFNIPGLTRGRDHDVLKLSADPSLLAIAQFSILLIEEFKSRSNEIFQLLAATIQQNPFHRSLRAVLTILDDRNFAELSTSRVTLNPMETLNEESGFFDVRNLPVGLRHKALKHLQAGAKAMEDATQSQLPGFCPLSRTLMNYSLGDGGLDIDDDPEGALRLLAECAERRNVAFQAIVVRMYDYFGVQMPEAVAKHANEYLANGVANGSLTACLDYVTYWPQLKYQTVDEPGTFLLNLKTRFSGGVGIEVDGRVMLLQDTALLETRLASGMSKTLLKAAYGLERGNNLIHGAAMLNLCETAEMLIRKFNIDLNEQNDDGDTPLLLACRHGNFEMIVRLLANKARPNIANKCGETPLHWAINVPDKPSEFGGRPIPSILQLAIMMLVDEKADINAKAQQIGRAHV